MLSYIPLKTKEDETIRCTKQNSMQIKSLFGVNEKRKKLTYISKEACISKQPNLLSCQCVSRGTGSTILNQLLTVISC